MIQELSYVGGQLVPAFHNPFQQKNTSSLGDGEAEILYFSSRLPRPNPLLSRGRKATGVSVVVLLFLLNLDPKEIDELTSVTS